MTRSMHFISGLPRAGSTLLAAILRQNPRVAAGMTSPVGTLLTAMLPHFSAGSEFGPVLDQGHRHRLLRSLFDSYYAQLPDDAVVFDCNRMWCAKLPLLAELYPQSKTIACVRNVAWVMDSLERLYRANPFENMQLFNDDKERSTVYSRVETLAHGARLVGFAYSALKEAYYGEHAASLLLIDYDLLTRSPAKVMGLIYRFLGERDFDHDFERVHYDAPQFDAPLGLTGLHRVREKVCAEPRRTVLPPDLFDQYSKLSFWHDGSGSQAHVIRAQAQRQPQTQTHAQPPVTSPRSHLEELIHATT